MTDASLTRSIRAIGILQYFVSGLFGVMVFLVPAVLFHSADFASSFRTVKLLPLLGICVFYFVLARSLRQFRPWARWVTIGISCIGVWAFPLGTLVNGAFLYVLFKGKHLFYAQQAVTTKSDGAAQAATSKPPPVPEKKSPSPD